MSTSPLNVPRDDSGSSRSRTFPLSGFSTFTVTFLLLTSS